VPARLAVSVERQGRGLGAGDERRHAPHAAVAKDGALLVADGGTIWRISYKGPPVERAAVPAEKTESEAKAQAVTGNAMSFRDRRSS
jgi:hypothetical protein